MDADITDPENVSSLFSEISLPPFTSNETPVKRQSGPRLTLIKVALINWLQEYLFSTNQDAMEKYKLRHLNNYV